MIDWTKPLTADECDIMRKTQVLKSPNHLWTSVLVPFGFGTRETASPIELYEPWLIENVGLREVDWCWGDLEASNNMMRVRFASDRDAMMFALTYGPGYQPRKD